MKEYQLVLTKRVRKQLSGEHLVTIDTKLYNIVERVYKISELDILNSFKRMLPMFNKEDFKIGLDGVITVDRRENENGRFYNRGTVISTYFAKVEEVKSIDVAKIIEKAKKPKNKYERLIEELTYLIVNPTCSLSSSDSSRLTYELNTNVMLRGNKGYCYRVYINGLRQFLPLKSTDDLISAANHVKTYLNIS